MKWSKAHKMKNLEKVIKRFKKDGQPKRARAVEMAMQLPHSLSILIMVKENITLVTQLAQIRHKAIKAKPKISMADCIANCKSK